MMITGTASWIHSVLLKIRHWKDVAARVSSFIEQDFPAESQLGVDHVNMFGVAADSTDIWKEGFHPSCKFERYEAIHKARLRMDQCDRGREEA
jgi:hypothetical protein